MAYTPEQVIRMITPNVAAQTTVVIPPAHSILQVIVENTTGNSVTGGIRIGTNEGGADVITAVQVLGNALFAIPDSSLNKRIFSLTAPTTLYISSVILFNSANLNFYFALRKVTN